MALIDLADLAGHVIGWQTLVGIPVSSRPWLRYQWLAQLGCHAIFWQSLIGLVLTGRAWFAMQYSAKLCLTSSLPTICTIPNYLHYSQLFATTTLSNYLHYSQLFTSISNRQTLVGMPCMNRPWLAFQFPADLGCETDDWHSLVAMLFCGRAWLVWYWLAKLGLLCNILLNYPLQAACPLFALFPTICTTPNYLHYFQLFATTLPNYSQLSALSPTIHKYFQQANLSWHAMHGQTLVSIPVSSRPWLWDQWLA